MRATFIAGITIAAGAFGGRAQSLILNGSFEAGTNPPTAQTYRLLGASNGDMTGWTVSANATSWINGDFLTTPDWNFKASDGSFFLDLTGTSDPRSP